VVYKKNKCIKKFLYFLVWKSLNIKHNKRIRDYKNNENMIIEKNNSSQSDVEPSDYKKILSQKNFIKDVPNLEAELIKKNIFLTDNEKLDISKVMKNYPMCISKYYISLICRKNDPIWNQCIPKIEEITNIRGKEDPLKEENGIFGLTHRYPDRCLSLISNTCAMYCRFCTRKRKVGEENKIPSEKDFNKMLRYISDHEEIRDIILSGGDPLMLSTKKLEKILKEVRKINHIEIIRIGTRVPCTYPQRIIKDKNLQTILKENSNNPALYINTHFEHPMEITEESKNACEILTNLGIPLGNQSIVLKNVNDNPTTFMELNRKLLAMKVKSYYLYQPDLVKGTFHFICPVSKGLEIVKGLRGYTSGMAVPQFVIDPPGGGGKIPLLPEYTKTLDDGSVKITNYQGKHFEYIIE